MQNSARKPETLAHHTFILRSVTQWQIHIQDLILLELPRCLLTLERFWAAWCQLAVFVFSETMTGGRFMGQRTSTQVPGPRFLNCSHDWCFSFDLWVVSMKTKLDFFFFYKSIQGHDNKSPRACKNEGKIYFYWHFPLRWTAVTPVKDEAIFFFIADFFFFLPTLNSALRLTHYRVSAVCAEDEYKQIVSVWIGYRCPCLMFENDPPHV